MCKPGCIWQYEFSLSTSKQIKSTTDRDECSKDIISIK